MSEHEHLRPAKREAIVGRLRQLALEFRQVIDRPDSTNDSLSTIFDEMDELEGRIDSVDVQSLIDEFT